MSGEAFALGLLALAIVAFISQPPRRMHGLILLTWFCGLLMLATLALLGGMMWIGTTFSLQMVLVAAVLTPMFAMCSMELLRRRTKT